MTYAPHPPTHTTTRAFEGKARFDDVYDQPDPRAYFASTAEVGYEIPHHGQTVFRQVIEALEVDQPTVVDVCCSYGINAALLKYDLELSDLYRHYCSEEVADVSTEELVTLDRTFYADRRLPDAPQVVGLDVSAPAVDYALDVDLLDAGAAENLERHDPSPGLAAAAGQADLITVTGGSTYVTERTFDRLLSCNTGSPPWVASLCLRQVSFDPFAACFARFGLATEQVPDVTFPQRRFKDDQERDRALAALDGRGIDPEGKESEGSYHANVYLSRPADAARQRPIEDILNLP